MDLLLEQRMQEIFYLTCNLIKNVESVLLLLVKYLAENGAEGPFDLKKARVLRKNVDQALDFSELISGDFLVHHQHGICRFDNLGKIENDGSVEETITVEFADGLMLHVPLQESHLLSRYIGLQKAKPKLARLGGKLWAKTKQAAETAALDLAADLLRLQATRESKSGHAFSQDDQWHKEFADSFPYVETPDQQKAIDLVRQDMEEEEPMDRLICGDVGFGKTEVAIKSCFQSSNGWEAGCSIGPDDNPVPTTF